MNALVHETSQTSKKSMAKPSKVVPSDKFGENKDNEECNNEHDEDECDEDEDQCNREEEVEFDSENERDVSGGEGKDGDDKGDFGVEPDGLEDDDMVCCGWIDEQYWYLSRTSSVSQAMSRGSRWRTITMRGRLLMCSK